MSIRDANVIIIETGRTAINAGLGLHVLLKTPTVQFPARVGLRRTSNGDTSSLKGKRKLHGLSSSFPSFSSPNTPVHEYLVGTQLDEALASGQEIQISWPFAAGDVVDWTQAEAIWKYVLFNQLQRRRVQNESPVLLSIAPGLSRDTYERICQIFFERFNVAGLAILERPMAQLYAANSLNGVVIDIGEEKTDITPIYDGFIVQHTHTSIPIGLRDCQHYLAHLLRANQTIMSALCPPGSTVDPDTILMELVKQIWADGLVKVPSDGETAIVEDEGVTDIAAVLVAGKEKAVIESGMKKKATAKASAAEQARAREIEALDLITVQFREHSLTMGKERHRFCEPLFDPSLLQGVPGVDNATIQVPPLQDAVSHAVAQADIEQRQYIWNGLFVTGDLTQHVKGIGVALRSRLAPFIGQPDLQTEVQPRLIRLLTLPEYFPEYRDTGEGFAAFLGASITAKIIFNDSQGRSFVSKADYTAKGPHSIIETNPSLL